MWKFVIWFVPAIVLIVVGSIIGLWGAGIGLAFVWIGFCIFQGSIIVEQQEYAVIERLGKFKMVYFRGWHIRVIGVDSIRGGAKGDLRAKQLKLYSETNPPNVDFSDASAPVDASIWRQIGNSDDIVAGRWEKVTESIRDWTYLYENPDQRIDDLVGGELRPLCQGKKISEANKDRDSIAHTVMEAVVQEMNKFGAYTPNDKKRLVISDIRIPPEIIALREMALEGEKRAQESVNEAAGYWKAIREIADHLHITVQEARGIFETQRGLDTIRETKPSITLVGKDLSGVLINLGVKGGEK
jgi:regulator of protease activity HflC (stomatin/prohibitin superfamily)